MELDAVRVGIAHLSNFLATPYRLIFLDQQSLVVGVGRQKRVVVLEDDQVAITTQTRACVHHTSVCCGQHRVTGFAGDVIAFVSHLIKPGQQCAGSGPDESDIFVARSGWRSSGRRGWCRSRRCGGRGRRNRRLGGTCRAGSGGWRNRRRRHRARDDTGIRGNSGCRSTWRRRHGGCDTKHLPDFDQVGVLQIVPTGDVFPALTCFQANANQGVSGLDGVIAGLSSIFSTGQRLDGCRDDSTWLNAGAGRMVRRCSAIFHRSLVQPGAAACQQNSRQRYGKPNHKTTRYEHKQFPLGNPRF